jgi:hypothetical protein
MEAMKAIIKIGAIADCVVAVVAVTVIGSRLQPRDLSNCYTKAEFGPPRC